MNKALLDTDILYELLKGINPTVGSNPSAYRQVFGHLTLSAMRRSWKSSPDCNGCKDPTASKNS